MHNHLDAVGAVNVEIKVVMHGDGVELLRVAKTNDALQRAIGSLKGQKVEFEICNFTLTRRNIAMTELFDADREDIVPSGVAELAHVQMQGYAYIKP
ncbi:MAG: DsrE family protein [Pseudomonadota bacterium]